MMFQRVLMRDSARFLELGWKADGPWYWSEGASDWWAWFQNAEL